MQERKQHLSFSKHFMLPMGGFLLFLTIMTGCTQNGGNPYLTIGTPNLVQVNDTVESTSLVGLHRDIFIPSCAISGCHDGHFEPDFRSVQSTYSTLVWQPIIKNNAQDEFQYRVLPFEPEKSVLYERVNNCCFVNKDDRMPQDQIGKALPSNEIEAIYTWIRQGAKDLAGKTRTHPLGNSDGKEISGND